jgi:hypothetical protein
MTKSYEYVGPPAIKERAATAPQGTPIESKADFERWVFSTVQERDKLGQVAATFVIDHRGTLRLADRRSEHVACSCGGPVLSAGEMFFSLADIRRIAVTEVSNQSTGYCPEPSSWSAVADALDRIGIAHPGRFTNAVVFRRCPTCGERNIVKEDWYVCSVCGGELPPDWNF